MDNKKNQELFQTFSTQVELKMMGDSKCSETDQGKILLAKEEPLLESRSKEESEGREILETNGSTRWRMSSACAVLI